MDIVRLIKNWTLPLAMVIGAVVYLIFAFVPALDGAAHFFSPICDAIMPSFMFLILFVTFCKVDFRALRPVAWHWWVLLFNFVFILVCMGLVLGFRLEGDSLILLEAILMCIISPGATASAVVTQKLGGSLEETTTHTFLSNFVTVMLVPVCFPMLEKGMHMSFLPAFFAILYKVAIILLLPMLLAYIVKHTPALHRFHLWVISVKDLSYYLWAASLLIVTGTTVKNIVHAQTSLALLLAIAFLGLVLCVIQFAVGKMIGHYFHRIVEAGQAMGQKNTAFAIWMAYTFLNPLSSVGPGCYILWQNIINSVEIWQKRRADEMNP